MIEKQPLHIRHWYWNKPSKEKVLIETPLVLVLYQAMNKKLNTAYLCSWSLFSQFYSEKLSVKPKNILFKDEN